MKQKELRTKADIIAENMTNPTEVATLKGLADLTENDKVKDLLSKDKDDIKDAVKAITSSVTDLSKAMGKNSVVDTVRMTTDLTTNTRLAKLSNPFNENLAIASAIKNLEGKAFAAGDNSSLSSVVKEYTTRFNEDNNLWGNILGAKNKAKKSSLNTKLYGLTLGYDKAFDSTIAGGYMTFAKADTENKNGLDLDTKLYQFGAYTRTYVGDSEIDLKTSIGTAKNKLDRDVKNKAMPNYQTGSFNSFLANFSAQYGYVFDLTDGMFVKPLVGLSYSYIKNKGFEESGNLPMAYSATKTKVATLNAGIEFRQYVENGKYLYITPGVEKDIYKSTGDLVANFVGSKKDIIFVGDKKKATRATLQTGAEMAINNALSTNLNFGAKVGSQDKAINGTVGFKYKF